ncbi:hypothetical protein N0V93_005431 [Gnomoniopsis smithogilvyi]|uniref:Actin-like ATPase domain-containing protein n=1 Tax=Gnomoniopsis smithogilvyi TaxID=1191159 RepID=A0A9W8YSV0_9PEZI|nr:hypothetical protein N0V93_005431 [Gnomoniopsis smithogilvyi]
MERNKKATRFSSVYVAVDFGTAFSGITFQGVKDGEGVGVSRQVRHWPSHRGHMDEAKVPTKLQYRLDDQGTYVVDAWGYEVQGDDDLTFEWFKLLLLKDEELPDYLRSSAQMAKLKLRLRKIKSKNPVVALGVNTGELMLRLETAIDVIADYLTILWAHAIDEEQTPPKGQIYDSLGLSILIVPIHVVFTVPAMWSDFAKDSMKAAATKSLIIGNANRIACLTTFEFLSEPEAAAHAYATEIVQILDIGETVLICDLGGGTGDCISYQLTNQDNFGLKEVVAGTGAICGGSLVDEAFKKLCKDVLHSQLQPTTAEGWHAILRDVWEHNIKRSFVYTGKAGPWRVPLSTQTENHVTFHEDQLRDVFNSSVVPIIIRLIQDQIDKIKAKTGKPPKMILPVGGFGRCPFIRQALEKEFAVGVKKGKSKMARSPIEILTDQGDMPWSAISRGAVEHALKPRVKTRIAQRSIGFQQKIPATKEDGGVYDEVFGDYRLFDGMTWVVKKGEEVSSTSKILAESWTYSDTDKKKLGSHRPTHVVEFYTYDGEDPPTRYGNGEGFQERGSMTLLVPVKIGDLPRTKDEDEEAIADLHVLDYDLRVNCSGASTEITAVTTGSLVSRSIREGTKIGEVTMDLDKMEGIKTESSACED